MSKWNFLSFYLERCCGTRHFRLFAMLFHADARFCPRFVVELYMLSDKTFRLSLRVLDSVISVSLRRSQLGSLRSPNRGVRGPRSGDQSRSTVSMSRVPAMTSSTGDR